MGLYDLPPGSTDGLVPTDAPLLPPGTPNFFAPPPSLAATVPAPPPLGASGIAPMPQVSSPELAALAEAQEAGNRMRNAERGFGPGTAQAALALYGRSGASQTKSPTDIEVTPQGVNPNAQPQDGGGGGMQLQMPRFVPAHYDASRNPWTQAGQAEWRAGKKQEAEALQTQAEIASGDALRRGDQIGQLADQIQTFDDAKKLAEARRMEEQRAKELEIGALVNDVQTSKIDPGRLMASASTGAQIGAALALAISGFAEGFTGKGGNKSLETLEGLIQKDIDAQKGLIDNKKAALMGKRALLGDMRQRFGDERQAEMATRIAMREYAGMRAQQLAEASGSEMVMAQAAQLQGQLQQKNALETRQLIDIPMFVPGQMVGGAGAPVASPDEQKRYVPAAGGYARTDAEGAKLRDTSAAVANVRALVNEAVALRNNPKAFFPGGDANARLEAIRGQLTLQVKTMGQLGALSEGDMGIIQSIAGDPTSWKPGTSAKLEYMAETAEKGLQRTFQQQGIQKVETGYKATPTGLKPTAAYTGQETRPIKGFTPAGGR